MDRSLRVESLDLRILTSLLRNGRITKVDLGEEVGLSPTPCYERMKRLEKTKVIRGYHADVNFRLLGDYSHFWVKIRLGEFTKANTAKFERMVRDRDDVLECHAILGNADYLVKVAAKSVEDYHDTMQAMAEKGGFFYESFPISQAIKEPHQSTLIRLIQRDHENA
ncbi:MAG: Lrp/AsnC family transcriptional regulator [Steroidobacteraceae bacterium]